VIAVGGGSADPESGAELRDIDATVTEPDETEHGLSMWSEQPGPFTGSPLSPKPPQQAGDVDDQFAGDVECGTIRDHVGSFW
jgi:hypothetical protein